MKFDDLDLKMRVFETSQDLLIIPDIFIVVRLDGRSFTRLTKEIGKFEAPFDERFRDLMVYTTNHLMNCGFNVLFGYTQSDEISLLFNKGEALFERKVRKIISILSGEASAAFSLKFGQIGVFDARVCQIPTEELVLDYFRWRNEDANRNCLNSHCYWLLRKEGLSGDKAFKKLAGLSTGAKNELLFQSGINYNDLPLWQKRGSGLYWENYKKKGFNPVKKEEVETTRRRIKIDFDLPMREKFEEFILQIIKGVG